ncbi:hypothetical protein TCAL_14757 [Tigriopus californicus]|uniref:Uncharacterized protein n=1 Tax=Tigriopus californicus TaxID=6832 RepID=A0A553PES8_TIGCA|nr:uncharacterized protein LOC131880184 [Tigriopus californicus]TRY76182.1 hypothetical protein TCAL_14757 [Tigriopus californicus]
MNLKKALRVNLGYCVALVIIFLVFLHVSVDVASGLERKTKFWLCLTQVTRKMIDCSQQRHLPCCRVIRHNRRKYSRNIHSDKSPIEFIELLKENTTTTRTSVFTPTTTSTSTTFSTTTATSTITTSIGTTAIDIITISPPTITTTLELLTTTPPQPTFSPTKSNSAFWGNNDLGTTIVSGDDSVPDKDDIPNEAPFRPEPKPLKVSKAQFKGGHRRGIPKNKRKNFYRPNRYFGLQFHEVKPHVGYNRALCMKIKVPCRFVNDHACCRFRMPIGLVARARSMDGSADLKWRGYPWPGSQPTGPEARSLFPAPASPTSSHVQYSHATNKRLVRIPEYHYNGSPEVASTLLDNCWRLHYVDCSASKFQSHPCCRLVTQEESNPISPSDNRLTRWLKLKDVS